ncbi:hypothetical protein CC1G_13310 [Coprinopsis cinerea okayama7|uniref:Uncharacterized protein n=1 Tax=Coprinopsis cinerea (strain Okayama-7 / 130 / ATCC MYA-4618 / FGSC 9003) TaxID=240176 RepID=A8PD97_COPC7|nr:hypothetical protein CC1G_13310 [Coprinopsis cinerea okayama7\|eukprot:XP_001840560.1 hypothetical protein CC1G_13310 [Coprinopsis cinerea okayama7\
MASSPSPDLVDRLAKVYNLVSSAASWTADNQNTKKIHLMHHTKKLHKLLDSKPSSPYFSPEHLGKAIHKWLKSDAAGYRKDPLSIPVEIFSFDATYSELPPLLAAAGVKSTLNAGKTLKNADQGSKEEDKKGKGEDKNVEQTLSS